MENKRCKIGKASFYILSQNGKSQYTKVWDSKPPYMASVHMLPQNQTNLSKTIPLKNIEKEAQKRNNQKGNLDTTSL